MEQETAQPGEHGRKEVAFPHRAPARENDEIVLRKGPSSGALDGSRVVPDRPEPRRDPAACVDDSAEGDIVALVDLPRLEMMPRGNQFVAVRNNGHARPRKAPDMGHPGRSESPEKGRREDLPRRNQPCPSSKILSRFRHAVAGRERLRTEEARAVHAGSLKNENRVGPPGQGTAGRDGHSFVGPQSTGKGLLRVNLADDPELGRSLASCASGGPRKEGVTIPGRPAERRHRHGRGNTGRHHPPEGGLDGNPFDATDRSYGVDHSTAGDSQREKPAKWTHLHTVPGSNRAAYKAPRRTYLTGAPSSSHPRAATVPARRHALSFAPRSQAP